MSAYGSNPAGPPPPPPGAPGNDLIQKLIIAAIAGAALVFLGSFLDWGTAKLEGESKSASGMDGDGLFTLISSLVAIGLLAYGMVKKDAKIAAISVAPSLVALGFAIWNVLDPERIIAATLEEEEGLSSDEASEAASLIAEHGEISGAIGIYLLIIGSLVAVVAGAIVAAKGRAASTAV